MFLQLPISSVLSKHTGSSTSSKQHFIAVNPLTPAPITATFMTNYYKENTIKVDHNDLKFGKHLCLHHQTFFKIL